VIKVEINHVKLSTYIISVATVIAGFIVLYPDAFGYITSTIGVDGRIVTAIVYFATVIYNGKFQASSEQADSIDAKA
jgi:cytosine/uracil/thiamine/allantoin permease